MNPKAGVLAFCSLTLSLLACLLLAGCEDPLQPAPQNPQIVLIQAPEQVYQFPISPAGIHVRADDPQGVQTLAGVQLAIRRANQTLLASYEMRDDGRDGDILPQDGQYFLPIDTALVHRETGAFILEAVARDSSGLRSETKKDTLTILPGRENRPPQLLSVTTPNLIWPDSVYRPSILARVSDPGGVQMVRLEIYPPSFPRPAFTDSLFDDGQHGDDAANDGLFGQLLVPARFGCKVGLFTFVFRAVAGAGGVSSAESKNVAVALLKEKNLPPIVFDLQAPTTISRNAKPDTHLISVRATDPNIPCDGIARVFFNTYKPNNELSSGSPFAMRDDGQQGDAVAGDGRYSLVIQITSLNATGNYRFELQAEDKKGALSEKLIHIITVTD